MCGVRGPLPVQAFGEAYLSKPVGRPTRANMWGALPEKAYVGRGPVPEQASGRPTRANMWGTLPEQACVVRGPLPRQDCGGGYLSKPVGGGGR